jgi:hypothetical protein
MNINPYLMWVFRALVVCVIQQSVRRVLCRDSKVYLVESTCMPMMGIISHLDNRVI